MYNDIDTFCLSCCKYFVDNGYIHTRHCKIMKNDWIIRLSSILSKHSELKEHLKKCNPNMNLSDKFIKKNNVLL